MRVLLLSDRLSRRGGADLHLLQVMTFVVEQGWDVVLAFGRREGECAIPSGVEAVQVRGLASMVEDSSRLGRLEGLLANADVVHLHNVMNPCALRKANRAGATIVTVQDHRYFCPGPGKTLGDGRRCETPFTAADCGACLPDDAYRRRMLRLTQSRRDAIEGAHLVVLSRYMAGELEAIGLNNADVIPPWFEVASAKSEPGDGFFMGGRLVEHKGVMAGYDAWQRSGETRPLLIVGDGPLESRFRSCRRLGWIGASEVMRVLREARALIFPSVWQEPFGMLGVEALSQGTPVVAMDNGGVEEWADAGVLRVPAGDLDAMAAALVVLSENDERALALGEQGRRMVESRFSRSTISARLSALYRAVGAEG